jgi:hypothetical protein
MPDAPNAPQITAADAGCWLDGSQGWHNNYRVIQRAVAYGWRPDVSPEDVQAGIGLYRDGSEGDAVTLSDGETLTYEDACGWIIDQGGLSDLATEYLNEVAPDGYEFVWDAGELSLMTTEDADEFGLHG